MNILRAVVLCVPFMFFNGLTAFAKGSGVGVESFPITVYIILGLIIGALVYCSGYNTGYIDGRLYEAGKYKSKQSTPHT